MKIAGALYTAGDCRAERSARRPPLPKRRVIAVRISSPNARCAACRWRAARSPASSRSAARSPASPSCWRWRLVELFMGNNGLDLPQLKVLNSVLRTKPLEGGPEEAIWASGFALRKRQDGGYTIADGAQNIVDLVPASFRYARNSCRPFRMSGARCASGSAAASSTRPAFRAAGRSMRPRPSNTTACSIPSHPRPCRMRR